MPIRPNDPPNLDRSTPHTASSVAPELRGRDERDLDPRQLAKVLRSIVGLPPDQRTPGEWAAAYRLDLGPEIPLVDVDAWIGWALAGLPLFSRRLPPLREARDAAARVLVVIAQDRAGGNMSAVARTLETSRKVLRDNMRRMGLYPWRAADTSGHQRGDDAT